ncbi:MAG TPA: radical SAM protein [Candidatus Nanoarchaeia archaeon]|nr:radical SAM protein [Candidatus Nanoarchaeia archaeon]
MGKRYTKLKIFHFQEKLDSLPKHVKKIMPPVHIRIKPTNVCNHRCSYCAYRQPDLQLGQDMVVRDFIPREKMKEIVKDLADMGVKAVTFSGGGEPLCYPYILETLKALAKTKIKFAALTNGALLKGEVAEIFAKHGSWIRVSMDGWDDESYKMYRSVGNGEYTRIMNNMKAFKKLGGKCVLGVSLIINKDNASHVYEMVKAVKKVGADSVKVSPCIISNEGKANNEYHAPFFKIVRDQIEKARKDFEDDKFEIFDAYHDQLESFEKDYTWCPYHQILMVIGADQNIYPCQDKAYNFENGVIGSIKDQSFKQFWFSNKNNFFKINPSIHCNNHCVSDAKNKLVFEYLDVDMDHLEFV